MSEAVQDSTTTNTEIVTIEGSAGIFRGKVTGTHIENLLMIIIFLMGIGTLYWQARENQGFFLKQHEVTQNLQANVIKNQQDIIKLLATGQERAERAAVVQTYVLAQDEKGRKSLNLLMPDELRYNAAARK